MPAAAARVVNSVVSATGALKNEYSYSTFAETFTLTLPLVAME